MCVCVCRVSLLDEAEAACPSKKPVVLQFYINRVFDVNEEDSCVKFDMYLKLNWRASTCTPSSLRLCVRVLTACAVRCAERWIGSSDDEFQATNFQKEEGWWFPGVEVRVSLAHTRMYVRVRC